MGKVGRLAAAKVAAEWAVAAVAPVVAGGWAMQPAAVAVGVEGAAAVAAAVAAAACPAGRATVARELERAVMAMEAH